MYGVVEDRAISVGLASLLGVHGCFKRQLQTGAGGAGLALARGGLARLATTRHDEGVVCVWLVVWWEKGGRERGFGLRSRESE